MGIVVFLFLGFVLGLKIFVLLKKKVIWKIKSNIFLFCNWMM